MNVRVRQFTVSQAGDLLEKPYFMMLDVDKLEVFGPRFGSEEPAQAAADKENEKRRKR